MEAYTIWKQISERNDVIKIDDLHYIKCYHPSLQFYHLVTWNSLDAELVVSELWGVEHSQERGGVVDLRNYNFLLLDTEHETDKVLLKFMLNDPTGKLWFDTIINPEDIALNFRQIAYNPNTAHQE